MDLSLDILPLFATLGVFAVAAAVVWYAGTQLTYLVDTLADRLHLARSLIGLLVLSLATSLPEVATTLRAALGQQKELVLNNLFGGIALQTAVLALADLWARGAITNYPRKANHALEATLLLVLLAYVQIVLTLGEPLAVGRVGLGSLGAGLIYAAAILLLRRYDDASDWVPVDVPGPAPDAAPRFFHASIRATTRGLVLRACAASVAILVLGVLLVLSAEEIARQSGLGASFVGVTLLAGATSLPELTTSITAVRMGAYTMAISNIFGSNLIMLVLVLPADLLFTEGPILRAAGPTVTLAIGFGMLVTSIFLVGLIVRRKPRVGRLGADSILVLAGFLLSLLAYYAVR